MNNQKRPILSAILAMSENHVIGKQNQLPWRMPADMRHFKEITTGHTVLMGRKTYESIGKPLPNRTNIVLTRHPHYQAPGCTVVATIIEALKFAEKQSPDKQEIFVIGGAEIYHLLLPYCDRIYLTLIHHHFDGDIYFPVIETRDWNEIKRIDCAADNENPYPYSFIWLERKQIRTNENEIL